MFQPLLQTGLNMKILTHDPLDQQTSHGMETGDWDPSEYHPPIEGLHLLLLALHTNFFSAPTANSHHTNTAMHVDALRQGCLFYNVPEPVQKNELDVGSKVFMTVVVQMMVIFWIFTLCSTGLFQHWGRIYYMHLQGDWLDAIHKVSFWRWKQYVPSKCQNKHLRASVGVGEERILKFKSLRDTNKS